MDAPGSDNSSGSLRDLAARLFYAGVGAVALTGERADELVDELAERGNISRAEARELLDDMMHRWRGDAARLGERAGSTVETVMKELGVVTRREWEELELRIAQIDHRLRLLEGRRPELTRPAP